MTKQKVLIVGMGKMGLALAGGLACNQNCELWGYDLHPDKMTAAQKFKGFCALKADGKPVEFDFVFLCVKPQDLEQAEKFTRGYMGSKTVLISILAGTTLAEIARVFSGHKGIVRAMPNIAALVGAAATGLAHDSYVGTDQLDFVDKMFATVGTCHWTKEELLDAVTGLSGSGPAYVYMMIEALADGGVKMGIPRRMALELSVQTLLGAGKLLKESGTHPAILREEVTTPGGTTIHAVQDLEERGLRAMLMSAVEKATLRSQSLRS